MQSLPTKMSNTKNMCFKILAALVWKYFKGLVWSQIIQKSLGITFVSSFLFFLFHVPGSDWLVDLLFLCPPTFLFIFPPFHFPSPALCVSVGFHLFMDLFSFFLSIFILYFWPSLSLFPSGSPDSNRLVVLLIHSKVGLQDDFRQLNLVLKAALVSQDIISDPPPPRLALPFL